MKRLNPAPWTLSHRNRGRKIAADLNNFAPRKPHRKIKPVGPDVGDRTQVASQCSLQPPIPVRGVEQPILQKISMHQSRLTDRPVGHAGVNLLTKRIVAEVVADSPHAPVFAREVD